METQHFDEGEEVIETSAPGSEIEETLEISPEPEPDLDALLQEQDPARWRVLHANDPEECERRSREATGVMLRMMRFGHY